MICRRCLQRASALSSRLVKPPQIQSPARPFSSSISRRAASSPAPDPPSPTTTDESSPPTFGTALGDEAAEDKPKLSACVEGTVLTGLNYFKGRTDPVALADEAYPSWLWKCLDTKKDTDEDAENDAGDEYSKSKKQRRLAAKRQRLTEARLLAEGNLDALAPKIPLQNQSINLPANESGTLEGAIASHDARETLRRAMQKERKAKIKETNYLKSM
ncbi:mitochondrial ribosomal protein L37-domain-containing protein [Hypoxylon fragiforme]|uniref:mitochondrial ribosomal protein L37-domain-containing protein n=1 Tax=Hypoxylon fragiforme TaxID=63214 RepID=UPI0020C68D62|nr:mitochondrial ribosomal protein L37-domain-containing protein [Hypoxylon fragiforme]KAI2613641.1 mitochondrial ribosomal protein L37-domain-containing protein [Hypoxylon fragiforme]